jgi:predicted nucleic acid-binding protein
VFLVDSTIWIEYFNGVRSPHTDYLDARLSKDFILVGDLMLAEVLQGFRNFADALMRFRIVQMVTPKLAVQSAQNFRLLRSKGVTVRKTIDSLIATWCIENDVPLLHLDSDFDGYEAHLGLRVIHP